MGGGPPADGGMAALVGVCLGLSFVTVVEAIDCYKCTSVDGSEPLCEDYFNQTSKENIPFIARNCVYGFFKGTHCFKLVGEKEDGTRITVRDCSDEDWGRFCGDIKYLKEGGGEEKINGCLDACDHDGCNTGHAPRPSSPALLAASSALVLGVMYFMTSS